MQDKKQLRKHFSELRKNSKTQENDRQIAERLLSHEKLKNARTVLLYASFGSEADTWHIAEKLLEKGTVLAYPKCRKDGIMKFHVIDSLARLRDGRRGMYGIYEPDEMLPQPVLSGDTVCIVPGLAFTENGGRLGYGGGYYDRFLAGLHEIYKIALSYEAILTDELPLLPHDLRVDSIVTEERTVLCNAG